MRKSYIFLAGLMAGIVPAIAADERREAGAHEHGHGRLNIAVEGNRVSMELEVPGADIVGFEHEASTAEQKATAETAKAALADALSLFALPAAAGCKLAEAKVEVHGQEEPEKAGHNHKHEAMHQESHSEFHVEYAIDCASPDKLTNIEFKYFDAFKGARELDVNLVTPKGQTSYEVTREQPKLELGEIG